MLYDKPLKIRLLALVTTLAVVVSFTMVLQTESASAATAIKISPASKTVTAGDKVNLKANKNVKWSVIGSKTNIKIVSKSARKATIKGIRPGTAYVKAKAGSKYKKVKIVVKKAASPVKDGAPTAIKASCTLDVIGVEEYCYMHVKSVEPANASSEVVFSTSDAGIATVDKNTGYIEGVSPGYVTITATSKLNSKVSTSVTIRVIETYRGTVTMNVDMTDADKYPKGKVAQLWIPVPQTDDDQNISTSTIYCVAKTAARKELSVDSAGNKVMYLMWDENAEPSDRTAQVTFHSSRREILRPDDLLAMESGTVNTDKFSEYLKETKRTGSLSEGIVRSTAEKAVKDAGAETIGEKATALYAWVCDNLRSNVRTEGLGTADAPYILKNREHMVCGSAEVSEVFVALCRAEGIPARSLYGIKLDSLAIYPYKPNIQNCITQFYVPGYGWAYADAASALDVICDNEELYRGVNAKYASKWSSVKEKNWLAVPASWLTLATGDDIELSPRQSASSDEEGEILNDDGTLCYFGFPYAEYDGKYIRCYNITSVNRAEIGYSYSFLADIDDCGCE